jgi:hypothetical protein
MHPLRPLALCVLALLPAAAHGETLRFSEAPCIDYHQYFQRIAIVTQSGSVGSVIADSKGLYYIADRTLWIVDATDPAHSRRLGHLVLDFSARHTALDDDVLLVGDLSNFFVRLFDVSVPHCILPLGVIPIPSRPEAVMLREDLVIVFYRGGTPEDGFLIADISNPVAPEVLSSMPLPLYPRSVTLQGNRLYVLWRSGSYVVLDISDPSNPTIVAMSELPGCAYSEDWEVRDDYAFVADYEKGLRICDVRNPAYPYLVGEGMLSHGSTLVMLHDSVARLVGGGYLDAFDVGNPTAPIHLGSALAAGYDLRTDGRYLFLTGGHGCEGVAVADLSPYSTPEFTSTYSVPPLTMFDVVDWDDHLYLAASTGLYTLDVSDPFAPLMAGVVDLQSAAHRIDADANVVGLAARQDGLKVVDVSEPTNPTLVGTVPPSDSAWDVDVMGRYAFVADGRAGLQIVDLEHSDAPVEIARVPLVRDIRAVGVSTEYAVTVANGLLTVINVRVPGQPVVVGHLYLPTLPTESDLVPVNLVMNGRHAYVLFDYGRLLVVDIGMPHRPKLIGSIELGGDPTGMTLKDGSVYVSGHQLGVTVVDMSEPEYPTVAANFSGPVSIGRGIEVLNDVVYVVDHRHGLRIFPAHCATGVARCWASVGAVRMETADRGSRFRGDPRAIELTVAGRNPSRSDARWRLVLPNPHRVLGTLHDVSGRRIRTLVERDLSAGEHSLVWDGRDHTGSVVRSGLYFCRVEAGGQVLTAKIVRID